MIGGAYILTNYNEINSNNVLSNIAYFNNNKILQQFRKPHEAVKIITETYRSNPQRL